MIRIDTAAIHATSTREPIFEIDGTEYTIPAEVGAEVGLKATKIASEQGEIAATMFIIDNTIGREAYDALTKVEGLPKKLLAGILQICRDKVFGGMEEEGKG